MATADRTPPEGSNWPNIAAAAPTDTMTSGILHSGATPCAHALTPVFAAGMEETFDQVWIKVQRRLARPHDHLEEEDDSQQIRHQSIQSIVVTSWDEEDGSSSIALGVAARAAANAQGSVCLVDADFHHHTLTTAAGLSKALGLHDVIEGKCRLEDAVRQICPGNLFILPCGRQVLRESLAVENRVQQVIGQLEEQFRFVIYDTACLKRGVEAYRWGRFVINTVLVVRAGVSRRQTIVHAVTAIRRQGMQLLGAVLNHRVDPIPAWLYPYF